MTTKLKEGIYVWSLGKDVRRRQREGIWKCNSLRAITLICPEILYFVARIYQS